MLNRQRLANCSGFGAKYAFQYTHNMRVLSYAHSLLVVLTYPGSWNVHRTSIIQSLLVYDLIVNVLTELDMIT